MTIKKTQKKKSDVKGKPVAKKKSGSKSADRNKTRKTASERDFFKRIFSSLPLLVGYIDEDGIICQASPRHEESFGLPLDKIIGQKFLKIFGKEPHEILKPYFREVLSGKPCHFATGIQGEKKFKGTFDVMLVPDATPDVDKNGFIYVIRDITHEKQTEIALKRVKKELARDVDIKFTPVGGTIEIKLARDDQGGISIEVADTGIGISDKDVPKAMAPFGQVDSALNRKYEGTGLGLPIVKSFVELHDGRFEISSTPGKGTIARVIFPPERMSAPS